MHRRSTAIPVRPALVLVLLALAALACNLGSADDETPTPNPTPSLTIPVQTPIPPVAFPTATPAPTQTLSSAQVPATPINCTPRRDWEIYFVQAGDTVSDLAARTGLTVDQVAQANCLIDPALIYVGQMLFLPFVPPTPTPIPSPSPTVTADPNRPVFTQALVAEQHWRDAAGWAVTYHDTVRLEAGEVLNALAVDFFASLPSGETRYIGRDSDPWDGAMVNYTFPQPGTYTFLVVAENEVTRLDGPVFTVRYDPNFTPPEGRFNTLLVAPNLGVTDGWYSLAAGQQVTITWQGGPVGALRIDFVYVPTGTQTSAELIGTDPVATDGAAITWVVPANALGYLQALAIMPDNASISSEIVNVVAE